MKLRIYIIISIVLSVVIGSMIFIGCASTPAEPEEPVFAADDLTNRLTLYGETLLLPEDWSFIHNTSSEGTLFNFRSPEGVEGGLERIDFNYDIDIDRLVDFYQDYVFQSDKKIRTEVIEHERFGTVVSFTGAANDRTLLSLLTADGNNVTFLHFSSSAESPFSLEKALLILNTYEKDERTLVSVREMSGAPLFTSFDNTWYWYGDFKDGYYMAVKGETFAKDIVAGLWTITPREVNQLKSDESFDIEPFVYKLRVRNIPTEFTVYGEVKTSRTMRVYTVFQLGLNTYCLYLIQDLFGNDQDPLTLLEQSEIQNLLDFHLLFSEDMEL